MSSKPLYLGLGAYFAGTLVVIAVLTAADYGSGEGAEGAKGEQVRLASTSAASDNARGQCLASCVTGCSSMVEVSGDPTGKGQALCIKSCSLACDGKARGETSFACSKEELQSLVSKLKDACTQVDRILGTSR